jgi:hypothetical protein
MDRQQIETEVQVELPKNFEKYDLEIQNLIVNYLKQLDMIEKRAYTIGKRHLGSSFNLIKSNGFLEWKKKLSLASTC